jgi:transportin-3
MAYLFKAGSGSGFPQVQRDYEELPVEQIPALREKLIALLLQSARASPALRTQLCLSLAALALHLPASQWQVFLQKR